MTDVQLRILLARVFTFVFKITAVGLAWYWYGWQLALIIFLLI